jgi:hypothetical protein
MFNGCEMPIPTWQQSVQENLDSKIVPIGSGEEKSATSSHKSSNSNYESERKKRSRNEEQSRNSTISNW